MILISSLNPEGGYIWGGCIVTPYNTNDPDIQNALLVAAILAAAAAAAAAAAEAMPSRLAEP